MKWVLLDEGSKIKEGDEIYMPVGEQWVRCIHIGKIYTNHEFAPIRRKTDGWGDKMIDKLKAIKELSDFINVNGRNPEERQYMHDCLSALEWA